MILGAVLVMLVLALCFGISLWTQPQCIGDGSNNVGSNNVGNNNDGSNNTNMMKPQQITQGLYAIVPDIVKAVNDALLAKEKAKGQPSTSLVATQADDAVQGARNKIAAGRSILNSATKVSAWLTKMESESLLQNIKSQEAALKP